MKSLNKIEVHKAIGIISLVIFLVSLIPILYVSKYNHPTGDDILYGLDAHRAWEETGSVGAAVAAASEGVIFNYHTWQGTFSAIFFMYLQPTVFSENAYFLTPFIVIGLLLYGSYYLLKQVGTYIAPMERAERLTIWSVVMFLSIQWVVAIGEAFYWYNGAVYYSGFYGIMMLILGMVCKYYHEGGKLRLVILSLLTVLLGGSNYITLLVTMILMMLIVDYGMWKKNSHKWGLLWIFLLLLVSFAISALAPGNAVRQATSASLPAYKAILLSLWQGFGYLSAWLNEWWVIGLVVLMPAFGRIYGRMKYKFSYPLLVVGFLYGLFCAMQCPTYFSMASTGPGRVLNLIHYGFVMCSYLAVFYVGGWCYRKLTTVFANVEMDTLAIVETLKSIWVFVFVVTIGFGCMMGLKDSTIKESSTMKAISDIVSGCGDAYNLEYENRLEILRQSQDEDIVFQPFANQPKTVYVGDLGQDAEFDANRAMAQWYHQKSIIVNWGM